MYCAFCVRCWLSYLWLSIAFHWTGCARFACRLLCFAVDSYRIHTQHIIQTVLHIQLSAIHSICPSIRSFCAFCVFFHFSLHSKGSTLINKNESLWVFEKYGICMIYNHRLQMIERMQRMPGDMTHWYCRSPSFFLFWFWKQFSFIVLKSAIVHYFQRFSLCCCSWYPLFVVKFIFVYRDVPFLTKDTVQFFSVDSFLLPFIPRNSQNISNSSRCFFDKWSGFFSLNFIKSITMSAGGKKKIKKTRHTEQIWNHHISMEEKKRDACDFDFDGIVHLSHYYHIPFERNGATVSIMWHWPHIS